MVKATSGSLYPRQRPGTHSTGGRVGPRAGLDGCGKSCLHRDSIPGPSTMTLIATNLLILHYFQIGPHREHRVLRLERPADDRKRKSVPLQAWSGPEGSRKLRFPDFMITAQDGGKVVSLTHRPPLSLRNTPGTHFC